MPWVLVVLLLAGSGTAEPIGQVTSLRGTVTVTRAGTSQAVQVGQLLEGGDRLTTQEQSACGLTLRDGARFALGPKSQLTLTQFAWGATTRAGSAVPQMTHGTAVLHSGGMTVSAPGAMHLQTPRTRLEIRHATVAVEVKP